MQSLVTTSEMVAAQAKYHPSCYAEYTRPKTKKQTQSPGVTEYKHYELEAFQIVVANCHKMIYKHAILKLQNLTAIMKDGLKITSSTKNNLRRSIENTFRNDIMCCCIHNLSQLKLQYWCSAKKNKKEKMITKVAYIIRKEVKNVKDDLPWSLQPNVLTSSQKSSTYRDS